MHERGKNWKLPFTKMWDIEYSEIKQLDCGKTVVGDKVSVSIKLSPRVGERSERYN